jgi:plastocyanin
VWAVAALVVAAGCGGGGGGDDGGDGTGPAVFTTLSVTPASVGLVLGGGTPPTQQLSVVAKDQNGAGMSGLTTTFTSANTNVATVSAAGVVTGVAAGNTQLTVTGQVGTVTKTTSVNVSVAVPGGSATVDATASNTFSPQTAFITRGGTVTWTFATLHNVTFGSGGPGNISDRSSGSASLTFPNAGTFNYSCTIHAGMTGSVVVSQ